MEENGGLTRLIETPAGEEGHFRAFLPGDLEYHGAVSAPCETWEAALAAGEQIALDAGRGRGDVLLVVVVGKVRHVETPLVAFRVPPPPMLHPPAPAASLLDGSGGGVSAR